MRQMRRRPAVAGADVTVGTFSRRRRTSDARLSVAIWLGRLCAPLLVSTACAANPLTDKVAAESSASTPFLPMLRQGLSLDHRLDQPVVLGEIDRVRHNPSYLAGLWPRIERHLPAICTRVRARRMPAEICLLPIVESGVNPTAVSRSGARGLWQLIPDTAKRYGLRVTGTVDERRDPSASTDAALRYLSDLQRRFGDWTLAFAAYNCGETHVARALRGTAAGESFFDLRWPKETALFVPRLLAFAAIFADPSAHGIVLPDGLRLSAASTAPDTALPRTAAVPATDQGRGFSRSASSLRETSTEAIAR